jgi:hypothetical protein
VCLIDIRNASTVEVDARDSQLHKDYTIGPGLGKGILFPGHNSSLVTVAFGPEDSELVRVL